MRSEQTYFVGRLLGFCLGDACLWLGRAVRNWRPALWQPCCGRSWHGVLGHGQPWGDSQGWWCLEDADAGAHLLVLQACLKCWQVFWQLYAMNCWGGGKKSSFCSKWKEGSTSSKSLRPALDHPRGSSQHLPRLWSRRQIHAAGSAVSRLRVTACAAKPVAWRCPARLFGFLLRRRSC